MLTAANQSLHEFHESGRLLPVVLPCLQRMVWLDFRLGLVSSALSWIATATYVAHHLMLEKARKDAYLKERTMQDMVLGALLLKTELWELKWLDSIPEVLRRLGLEHSRMMLLYALGYEDFLRQDGTIPKTETSDAIRDLLLKTSDQPANKELPARPEFLRAKRVVFRSWVIGCEIVAEADNTLASVSLTQAVLATLESLLATSLDWQILPQRPRLLLSVESSELYSAPRFTFVDTDQGDILRITHPARIPMASTQEQHELQEWLLDLVAHILPRIAVIPKIDDYLLRLARDEAAFGRALGTYGIELFMRNILGPSPKYCLDDWDVGDGGVRFPLKRSEPWADIVPEHKKMERIPLKPGSGNPPPELFVTEGLKHHDRRVFSLIDAPLWDRAGWRGVMYLYPPDELTVPMLALAFTDREAGGTIFRRWQTELGHTDSNERLRVSIIRGVDREHPYAYRVIIGCNPETTAGEATAAHFIMVSRIHRLDPADSANLDGFLKQFEAVKRYVIIPGHLSASNEFLGICPSLGIEKCELHVRHAWTIGENDLDITALAPDENPVIPEDVVDPPINRAKKRIAELQKRQGRSRSSDPA